MAADVHAQDILLKSKQLLFGVFPHIGKGNLKLVPGLIAGNVKQTQLALKHGFALPGLFLQHGGRHRHLLAPGSGQGIQSA